MSALGGFFFLDIPPAVPLVCAVKLRPSVRRWRFCAHHQEEEGGRTRGGGGGGVVEGGGHQPAAVSESGCGSTHITARTHMRLFSRPGQTGRRGVSQSVSQPAQQNRAAEKVPAAPLTPKLPEPLRRWMSDSVFLSRSSLSDIIPDRSSRTGRST